MNKAGYFWLTNAKKIFFLPKIFVEQQFWQYPKKFFALCASFKKTKMPEVNIEFFNNSFYLGAAVGLSAHFFAQAVNGRSYARSMCCQSKSEETCFKN